MGAGELPAAIGCLSAVLTEARQVNEDPAPATTLDSTTGDRSGAWRRLENGGSRESSAADVRVMNH